MCVAFAWRIVMRKRLFKSNDSRIFTAHNAYEYESESQLFVFIHGFANNFSLCYITVFQRQIYSFSAGKYVELYANYTISILCVECKKISPYESKPSLRVSKGLACIKTKIYNNVHVLICTFWKSVSSSGLMHDRLLLRLDCTRTSHLAPAHTHHARIKKIRVIIVAVVVLSILFYFVVLFVFIHVFIF